MKTTTSRRSFVKTGLLAGTALLTPGAARQAPAVVSRTARPLNGPVAIASANGLEAVQRAVDVMQAGGEALDGIIAGVNLVEEDPDDITVGYGGVPNEQGIVELDSAVMHGPTCRAGAVASLRNIKHPSRVARVVMERTDHVLLVGAGALDFARMHGFPEEDLLTDRARELWVRWKETLSTDDDYLPPHDADDRDLGADLRAIERSYGTIHCSGLDLSGTMSSVTTTSGLFFKIPGRVGDSPIVGAGLYVDNEVGAAGSTGRGEANLENLSSFLIVERMRAGDAPQDACLYACRRIAERTRLARLQDAQGRPNFNVKFYAMNRAGEAGGAEIWGGDGTMAVADAAGARLIDLAYLYQEES